MTALNEPTGGGIRPRIAYPAAMPDDLRRMLGRYVERWSWLAPRWCEELIVRFEEIEGDGLAECSVRRDYRWAHIMIGPGFLASYRETERDEIIIHELLHIHHTALSEVFGDILDTYVADDKQRKMLAAQKQRAIEMMTVDLTTSLVARVHATRTWLGDDDAHAG